MTAELYCIYKTKQNHEEEYEHAKSHTKKVFELK